MDGQRVQQERDYQPLYQDQQVPQNRNNQFLQQDLNNDNDDQLFQQNPNSSGNYGNNDNNGLLNGNNNMLQMAQFIQQFLNQQNQQNQQQSWGAFLPTFSGEDQQDPITWLRDYNAAAGANGWNDVRKLQVVPAYLRSTAAEWYQSLNPGLITTWTAGINGNVNNFEDRFLRRFRTAAMIEAWTIKLEQRVQGPNEKVEQYVSDLQKLFTRVGGYNEGQKTRKFISGLTRDLYIMVQSTHEGNLQNAIDLAKRCEMTLVAGKNKNISNYYSQYSSSTQLETTQLAQMMVELSKSVSEIKEKVGNQSYYNNRWNRNGSNNNNGNNNNMGGNRPPVVCYTCGEPGHISRTCPNRNNNNGGGGSNSNVNGSLN